MGERRVDDPQHPRGYREIRSNAEMRKLMVTCPAFLNQP
jgi:hypothetical protein